MKVIALPVTEERNHEVRAALEMTGNAVNELLALAVVESRAARTRLQASPAGQLHARAAAAYTKSVAVLLDKPGVDDELNLLLDAGEFDIRKLAGFARSWTPEDPDDLCAA
ncbi:hypothetical protein [Arthrobacter caoxuetaonis]|uniref:Uncharacterized protein n=1 Tax=Arthrobacter caoxuetaonis TaxID=2886935 RepID=A0A9X1SDN0_9MICC|nr:hypothetical protein [Arthrobacter caoxuetaonis]MCC3299338.1 hypothetical protein [Arthrobacter caoxuetaonis]USQ59169.1 hypothetical protein NF551_18860 [Arthrobacter caoxuetaonis]